MYLLEYLKHGDLVSIVAAVKYLLFKKSHNKDRIVKTSVGLFYCRKNTNDFQFANLHYEWGVKKYVLNHINEYNVFIDGGSCVGEYCILLHKYNVRCIAFEPISSNFDVLKKNLELNHLTDKVEAYAIGLSNINSRVSFVYNPVNTGASHIARRTDKIDCDSEIRTFDSLLPDLKLDPNDRILFKLDVEGMELEAIKGATKFIESYPNITFIMEDKHSGKDKIIEILNAKAKFEFGVVDEYNIFAKKIKNKPLKNL
jgi:FkbM family methyltransferase